jgi:hypothetical protein
VDGGEPVLEQVPDQVAQQCSEYLGGDFQPAPGPAEWNAGEEANGLGRFQQGGDRFQVLLDDG